MREKLAFPAKMALATDPCLRSSASEASGGISRKERACVRAVGGHPELTGWGSLAEHSHLCV